MAVEPKITDGVRNAAGDLFVQVRGPNGSVWLPVQELQNNPGKAITSLVQSAGLVLLTNGSKNLLLQKVEAFSVFRDGVTVSRRGWNSGHAYGLLDGTHVAATNTSVDLSTLDRQPRFEPRGTLEQWQAALKPFVPCSKLLFFAMGVALAGPLLRFMPEGVPNIFVEFYGGQEQGKTTTAIAANTIFGHVPGDPLGIAQTWNLTKGAFELFRIRHADGLLVLDEAENLVNADLRHQLVTAVIMSGSGSRGRATQHDLNLDTIRNTFISTSNNRLTDILKTDGDTRSATVSRVLSIEVGADLPMWQSFPSGCSTSLEAVQALQSAIPRAWGSPARHFITKIASAASANEVQFTARVERLFQQASSLLGMPHLDPRQRDMLAAIAVTLRLAQSWAVLPATWGKPLATVRAVLPVERSDADRVIDVFVDLAIRNVDALDTVSRRTPGSHIVLDESRIGGPYLIFDPRWLKTLMPDRLTLLRQARTINRLLTNTRGGRPRLDYRAPPNWRFAKGTTVEAVTLSAAQALRVRAAIERPPP